MEAQLENMHLASLPASQHARTRAHARTHTLHHKLLD